MAGVWFTDLQSRPTACLDCPSVTRDAFLRLVPPLEAAGQAPLSAWRVDGHPRTARRCPMDQTSKGQNIHATAESSGRVSLTRG